MEFLKNLYLLRDFSNKDLSNALHTIQEEMICNSNNRYEKKNKILAELYQITSIPISQINMDPKRWDELRFNIYLVIASMLPNYKLFPNLNLSTDSGPLFYIMSFLQPSNLIMLYQHIGIKQENVHQLAPPSFIAPQDYYTKDKFISVLTNIFKEFIQSIINAKTSSFQFYTRSSLSYGQFIPSILLRENRDFFKDPIFFEVFRYIKNQYNEKLMDSKKKIILTHQMHAFIHELISITGMYKIKDLMNEEYESIAPTFRDIQISSTLIPFYFHFIIAKIKFKDDESSIVDIFYQNSLLRVNDIFKNFSSSQPFGIIFDYFNKAFKTYNSPPQSKNAFSKKVIIDLIFFICQILTIPNTTDISRRTQSRKQDQEFLNNLFTLYFQNDFCWPCLYLIEKIISTLTFFTMKINIIKAIKIRDASNKNFNIDKTISFYDQLPETDLFMSMSSFKEKQMNNANNNVPQPNVNIGGNSYQAFNLNEDFSKEKVDSRYTRNCYMNKMNDNIDKLLFSAFECRSYSSYEEALSAYEKLLKVYDIFKRIVVPLNQFGFPILKSLLSQIDQVSSQSTLCFYLEKLLRAFFNLIIFSSYRCMLLNTFFKTLQKNKSIANQQIGRPAEYAFNYSKNFNEIINRLNLKNPTLVLIASILADCLYNATKKQIVTNQCVRCVLNIIRSQANTLTNLLIQKMMEIAYQNYYMESSYDNSQVVLFQQWIFLIIKIGGKKGPSTPFGNSQFFQFLRNFQHTFISYFFTRVNQMNQPEMILTFYKYIAAMKANASENNLKQIENTESKVLLKSQRYFIYNDFNLEYQTEVSNLYMDRAIFDISENQINPTLIIHSLSSGNNEVVRNAISILSKQFLRTEYYIDYENDMKNFSLREILDSIKYLPKELQIKLIDSIPKIPPLFSPYIPSIHLKKQSYFINIDPEIDNYYRPFNGDESQLSNEHNSMASILYLQLLASINRNSSRTITEAKHLLMLVAILVDSGQVLFFSMSDLDRTLDTLFSIARFTSLRPQVEAIIKKMNNIFYPIIKSGKSLDYVYAFTYSFQITQMDASKYAINQFKSFLNGIEMTNYDAIEIANNLFARIRNPYNIFNTLLLFTNLLAKRPECIKIDHFTSLFSLIKDQNYFSQVSKEIQLFRKLFKKFLEKFIQSLNNKNQKEVFMKYLITIVASRSFNNYIIKSTIVKKIPLIGLQYNYYDPSFYKTTNDELFYSYLSIIIGCGSKVPLSQEIVDHAINLLSSGDGKQQFYLQYRLNFFLMLTKANTDIISPFLEKDKLAKIFSTLFKYYYSAQYAKKTDKCFRWIYSQNQELVKTILKKNFANLPDQNPNLLIKDDKKFRFFMHYLSFFSEFIEPNRLVLVFNLVTEIRKQMKIQFINNILNLIKLLVSFDFKRQDLRAVVLGSSQPNSQITLLSQFIVDMSKLFSFPTIPVEDIFKPRVISFLLNFKSETIFFVFSNSYDSGTKCYYDILYSMILADKTNEMFEKFIHMIHPSDPFQTQVQKFPNQHPYIFDLEKKLSEEKEYASNELFKDLVKNQFNIFFNRKQNKILTDNDSNQLNSIVNTYINVLKIFPEFSSLVNLSEFFAFGSNVYTTLYLKFKSDIFSNREKSFYIDTIQHILDVCSSYEETDNENKVIVKAVNLLPIELADSQSNNGQYHFMTNSTTTIILSNLIKGIGAFPIDTNEKLFNHLLSVLSMMLINEAQVFCGMKCYYNLFKVNQKLPDALLYQLKNIILAFPSLLQQPEPYPIILIFKFAYKLLNRDLLPEPVLSNILQHVFSFPKFMDNPYLSSLTLLFKKANVYYSNEEHPISDELSDSFKVFIIDKILFFREIDKAFYILKVFPAITKTLPFSVLASMIHNIDIRDKNQVNLQISNIDLALRLSASHSETSENIISILCKISFDFIFKYLEKAETEQTYQTQMEQQNQCFLNLIMILMKHGNLMPENFIVSAARKMQHAAAGVARLCQTICILSTEFADQSIVIKYAKEIMRSFELLAKEDNFKQNIQSIKIYIQSIFNRPNLQEFFVNHFLSFLESLTKKNDQMPSLKKFEASFLFLSTFVRETKHPNKLTYLIQFWDDIDESSTPIARQWINSFIDFIGEIPIEQHEYFLDFIFTKIKKDSLQMPYNISILQSQNVSISLKIKYLMYIQKTLPTLTYEELYSLIKVIEDFPFDCTSYRIICHLYLIMASTDESRLIHIDQIQHILGKTEEERFVSLISFIPPKLWKNTNLVFIILLCMKHTKIVKPLAMLADCFETIAAKFAIPLFVRLMNEKTVSLFHELLKSVLFFKKSYRYSELISSIINTYSKSSIQIPGSTISLRQGTIFNNTSPNLLYKSVKLTNDGYLFTNNISMSQINELPDKLLLPNAVNDDIFSLLPANSSIEALSASAQFFLSNYEESSKVFNGFGSAIFSSDSTNPESSPESSNENQSSSLVNLSIDPMHNSNSNVNRLLNRMMEISDDFVSKAGTFSIFERYGHDDPLLIPTLENALNSMNRLAVDSAKNEISLAKIYNILYLKHHRYQSVYELQRIILVEMVLNLMGQKISYKHGLPPSITSMYNAQNKSPPPPLPTTTAPNVSSGQNPNMNKKAAPPQIVLPSSIIKTPLIYIKSLFFPIYESFISKFENFLFMNERSSNSKSKDNQQPTPLNLNFFMNSRINQNVDLNATTAIFSHEYRSLFDSVIDINSYGFFSVTMSQVDKATENFLFSIKQQQQQQQQQQGGIGNNFYPDIKQNVSINSASSVYKRESAEEKWPGFCFSLLTMSSTPSPSLHLAALQGYYKLARKSSMAYFIHESYFARLMTLFTISVVYMDDNLINNSLKIAEHVFREKSLLSYSKFWSPQIAFLQSHPKFAAYLADVIKPYSSLQQTMHAHGLIKKPFTEQLEFINYLRMLFSFIFDLSMSYFDNEDEEDDEEDETYNQISIEKCNKVCLNYKTIESELEFDVKEKINKLVMKLNQLFPVDFELSASPKVSHASRLKIFHINNDFMKLSENVIAFTALTTNSTNQLFLVEKVQSTDRIISFSNTLFLLRQMLKYSYGARVRNIKLFAPLSIEIGEGMVMYPFPCDSVPISRFRFCNRYSSNLPGQTIPFYLKQYVVESGIYNPQSFIEAKNLLISNFAAYSALRSIFSLDKPTEDQLFVSFVTAEVPYLLSNFSVPQNYAKTATLIPKILADFFSNTSNISGSDVDNTDENLIKFDRHFEISFAAIHQSFASYIDTFRAIVEMPIQESLHPRNKHIDNILAARDIIEAGLFDYAPPFSDGATSSDSVEWFTRISEYVENSKNPSFQRVVVDNPRAVSIPTTSNIPIMQTSSHDTFGLASPSNSMTNFNAPTNLGLNDDLNQGFDLVFGVNDNSLTPNTTMNINSMGSLGKLNPSTSTSFETNEISRNNSLLNFGSTDNSGAINLYGTNSFDFGGDIFNQQSPQPSQQMLNMPMITPPPPPPPQPQLQPPPPPQPYMNNRVNSFDNGFFGYSNPQPIPKVVSPQIQITPPHQQMPPPPPPSDLNDDQDDDISSIFF